MFTRQTLIDCDVEHVSVSDGREGWVPMALGLQNGLVLAIKVLSVRT